jgi:beta-glucosidase
LQAAKKRGLTTMVTLWHWTNPIWFTEEGGWKNKKAVDYFSRYTSLIVKELGGDIDLWTTLNEPMAFVGFGYVLGKHPPCKKWHFLTANKIFNNLTKAHKMSYKIIHHHFPGAKVSFNSLTDYFEPYIKWDPLHNLLVKFAGYLHHGRFLNRTKKYLDYIAVNYYFHNRASYLPPFKMNKNRSLTDMGWEIYPEGIYHVLKYYQKFKNVPIYITENGIADENDSMRAKFIIDHLKYVHQAISEGVNVRGYFHWSFMDNFEWAWGWGPKFGLYAVDRATQTRTPRPSAAVYAEICKNNKLIL